MTALAGALVADDSPWQIPRYARDMLWVQQGEQAVQVQGERGVFTLPAPADPRESIAVVWGAPGGPQLAMWSFPETSAPLVLGWEGEARIGGFVERIHVRESRDLELVIAEIDGGPLVPDYRTLPGLDEMRGEPFRRGPEPDLATSTRHTYFVLTLADSLLSEYLYHAMVSELAANCFAALGPQAGGWHEIVGMPLLLESLALLAPGYRVRLG